MCGIFAFIGDVDEGDVKQIDQLVDYGMKCQSRGPDNTNYITSSNSFLMFHRLMINDTSMSANQPMTLDDGEIRMMCNGEIYNHKELEDKYEIKTN